MMGEFIEKVSEIASTIDEVASAKKGKGLKVSELVDIVGNSTNVPINCYPGIEGGTCYKEAYFISLHDKQYVGTRRKKGHLTFAGALREIVRHMQGLCPNKTYHAVLITDRWDSELFRYWKSNFEEIKLIATIEFYLIESGKCTQIKV